MSHPLARALGVSLLLSGVLSLLAAVTAHVAGDERGTHASAVWVLAVLGLVLVGNALVVLVVEAEVRAGQRSPSA